MQNKRTFLAVFLSIFFIANTGKKPEYVILMIGDGMGIGHITAAMFLQPEMHLKKFPYVGLMTTYSYDNLVTDSGAGGTAIATGNKTYNGAISVDPGKKPLKTLLELAKEKNYATGVIVTSSITHATPATFLAHSHHRDREYDIAVSIAENEPDVAFGGGRKFFQNRPDGLNLIETLRKKNYELFFSLEELRNLKSPDPGKKYIALLDEEGLPPVAISGNNRSGFWKRYSSQETPKTREKDTLEVMTRKALEILKARSKPFFLLIEGSQIDWASHKNDPVYLTEEVLDFDRTIGAVLEFARKHPSTLVIVTADHETGGVAVKGGKHPSQIREISHLETGFVSDDHTANLVPVFAFGPGAERFSGIYDNTDIFKKLKSLWLD